MPVIAPPDANDKPVKSGQPSQPSQPAQNPTRLPPDFKRWVLAGLVVTIPLILINREREDWSYPYVILILLSLVVFYSKDLSTFIAEVQRI